MRAVGLFIVAAASLALLAAGCGGGGGGGAKLTKDEYATQLSAICKVSNDKLNALGLSSLAGFKTHGEEAITIAKDTVEQFKKLKGPDELQQASKTFNASGDEIVDDLKKATEAAKNDDQAAFDAAGASVQNHAKENDDAATEIGAAECVGG